MLENTVKQTELTWHTAPMQSDFTGFVVYTKNSNRVVSVKVSVIKADDSLFATGDNTMFCTLPVGFRPDTDYASSLGILIGRNGGTQEVVARLIVNPDGQMVFYNSPFTPNSHQFAAYITYLSEA